MADIVRFQLRRDSAANWASFNPVLAEGEPGLEKDTRRQKVGDGTTPWNALPYSDVTEELVAQTLSAASETVSNRDLAVTARTAAETARNGAESAAARAEAIPATTDGIVGGLITDPASQVNGLLTATYAPKWKPSTAYSAGDAVLNPAGDTVTAKAAHTSGTSYDAAKWNQSGLYEALRNTAQPLRASLPQFTKVLSTYDDSVHPTVRVIDLGSSVGVGATLPDASTQAPGPRLFSQLSPVVNRLGNVTLANTNGSVNGSTISGGLSTDYAAAKTTAGGAPNLVVMAYGMNDGMPEQYHRGQTYPGFYSAGLNLVQAAQNDGADVIIFTTPHPRTDIMPDSSWALSGASSYPSTTPIPALTQAASVVNVTTQSGATVQASYRHLRVNQSLRRLAADTGAVLIDAERYWFEAVAEQGLANLFNTGEYAHPNLLGHQLSYWKAIDDFVRSFSRSTVQGGAAPVAAAPILKYKVGNTGYTSTTTLANDSQLAFNVGPNQVWEVTVTAFYTGTAGDLRVGLNLPSGSAGRAGIHGPATDAAAFTSHPMTSRSVPLPDTYGLPVGGNAADAHATFKALVRVGATGGTITAQFCQDTSSATTTTVYGDSHLRALRVA